ncbi:membrane protein [Klugiella xanthotipulae]|uniref:Integral membrane protein n=2 Tax=Klugiella xanthotipulae TaxID=244735 RepID=A0A543I4L6_9MICO|nr:hypothetical protein [Klugiella xanthotipulae]TQM65509.1 hypothetical protein FB466_0313 [Klugiella xanthotipulae]
MSGLGRLLVAIYGILALAATVRSLYQILSRFNEAPVAYLLSGLAGAVYIVATIALIRQGPWWRRVAGAAILFELLGVLVVGTLSITLGDLFPHDTVWSVYGRGYGFIPLLLPIAGLVWLWRSDPTRVRSEPIGSEPIRSEPIRSEAAGSSEAEK